MTTETPVQQEAPPAGEDLHLPGPTIVPLLNAVGLSLAVIGLTMGWFVIAAGLILFLVTTVRWIRDTVRDVNELPVDPHH